MFHRLRKVVATAWFDFGVRGIERTPPLRCVPGPGPVVVSQVCHRDVSMYLLAVKSLARFVPPRQVFVLDDGSLTASDRRWLTRHVRPVEIIPVSAVANPNCPQGKTWERLLFIADLVPSEYVVQLDSDTLTLEEPREMIQCLRDNVSFTIPGDDGEHVVSAPEIAARMRPWASNGDGHVQVVAEAEMDQVTGIPNLRYVRGCSAFTGFARGSMDRGTVERFSKALEAALGPTKWNEWGSEQVTSCLVVANTPGARVLPFARYCYERPELKLEDRSFVHFMGTYRFRYGRYRRLGRRVVRELSPRLTAGRCEPSQ
jgi:hypothetical protein